MANGTAGASPPPVGASCSSSTVTVSPPASTWRLGRGSPSTWTRPASMWRWARDREPSGPARKASRRCPASSGGTRSSGTPLARALEHVDEREHTDGDGDVGHVEGRPVGQLDEVGHRPRVDAVDDVPDRAAHEQAGGQPQAGLVGVADEIEDERDQGDHRDQEDQYPTARERAEGDAGVAHVDEVDAEEDRIRRADPDVPAHERLRDLVERDDAGERDARAGPRAHQPAMRLATICVTNCSTITPTIGEMSSGPIMGRNDRKIRR